MNEKEQPTYINNVDDLFLLVYDMPERGLYHLFRPYKLQAPYRLLQIP